MAQLIMRVARLQRVLDLNAAGVIVANEILLIQDAGWMAIPEEMGAATAEKQHAAVSTRNRLCLDRECSNLTGSDSLYCRKCDEETEQDIKRAEQMEKEVADGDVP